MYSYEDRVPAVQLNIQLGKQVAATIRVLGYPTKNARKTWHQEYKKRLGPAAGYARLPKYSRAQKELAVAHYLEHGRCIAATLRALGYPARDSLSAWLQELHPDTRIRVVGRDSEKPMPTPAMKQAAVIALCTRQGSGQAVAQQLGVCRPTLYNWKNQLLSPARSTSMKPQKGSAPGLEQAELEQQLDGFRKDIRRLQLEQDMLKKVNELIKKEVGIDRQLLSNRERATLVDALRQTFGLTELLNETGLARSAYFYHRARLDVADKYAEVRRTMTEIFESNHRCHGYRRMQASLGTQRMCISEKVVQRLMKRECLIAATPKRRRYGS